MKTRASEIIIFIMPVITILLIMLFFPLIYSFWISFNELNLSKSYLIPSFTGITNYVKVITDSRIWDSSIRTIEFVGMSIILELGIGLGLALALMRIRRGATFYRTISLFPLMIAPALAAVLFRSMLNSDYGIVNYMITSLGFKGFSWLSDPNIVIFVFVLLDIWQNSPFAFLIFYSGLRSIPEQLYEASRLDGASSFQRAKYITFPLLKRVFIIVLIIRLLALVQAYDHISLLTGGGPGYASQFITWTIYVTWQRFFDFGVASALSWLVLLIIIPLILTFSKLVVNE